MNDRIFARMTNFYTVTCGLPQGMFLTSPQQICLYEDSCVVSVASAAGSVITLTKKLDITKEYRLLIKGLGECRVHPGEIFDCPEFIEQYTYEGKDLGSVIGDGVTTFKLWAPTASKVVLNLFSAGNDCSAYAHMEMCKGEQGVWELVVPCGHGTYYTYTVTTAMGSQEATDPYARSAGVNGLRSMVVDLKSTNPEKWDAPYIAGTDSYTKAIIWEIHIRDFSNRIDKSCYRGKYLAFTERGLTNSAGVAVGVDHLAALGVTHVHLMPTFDYATVDESQPDKTFNWGYDPQNFNVPEGSYATDPYHGEVRIREFKQMVQALHEAGIGVVMDMVYNHTYDANNALNRIVPYYYYRFRPDGERTNACGCGNDTASERKMFRKLMVESVRYWMEEYQLDGLRFDLMGLHDVETMQQVEQAAHGVNPNAILYGEGWDMAGDTTKAIMATQANIAQIHPSYGATGAIAVFNDTIRDGLKGAYDRESARGYINGCYRENAEKIQFGFAGGRGPGAWWSVSNGAVVNYMSCHDNHTLWDKLLLSNPEHTVAQRLAMNRLGAAIVLTSRGMPFWQAGEEMLRTKNGCGNSYNAPDVVNNLDWEKLIPGSDSYAMTQYYRGLIAMRKAISVLTTSEEVSVSFEDLPGGGMIVTFQGAAEQCAKVVVNPSSQADTFYLEGQWKRMADDGRAGNMPLGMDSGEVNIPACSVIVYFQ